MNPLSSSPDTFDLSRFQGWIDHYARMRGITIVVDETLPAPIAMPDDIENPRILVNPRRIHAEMQLTDDEKLVVFFHELEHMFENIELQRTVEGQRIYQEKMQRIEKSMNKNNPDFLSGWGPRFHPQTGQMMGQGAMLALENSLRDIYVNRQVIDPRKAPALRGVMQSLYRTKAFRESDYLHFPIHGSDGQPTGETRALPKHIQFQYAILREAMITIDECVVHSEVRAFLSQLQTLRTDQLVTEGSLLTRLPAIWKHIEPTYRKWYEEDLEQHEEEKKQEGKKGENGKSGESDSGEGEKGDGKNSGEQGNREDGNGENQNEKGEGQSGTGNQGIPTEGQKDDANQEKPPESKPHLTPPSQGEDGTSGAGNGGQTLPPSEGQEPGEGSEQNSGEGKTGNPIENLNEGDVGKNPFEEWYDQGIPHILPEKGDPSKPAELSEDGLETILKKLVDKQEMEKNKTPEERAIEERVRRMGVDPNTSDFQSKKSQLQAYERFRKSLMNQSDKDGKNLSEALQEIFARIIARRQKPKKTSKGPVREDHSDGGLDMGAVPGAIADIMGGRSSSEVEMYTRQAVREKLDTFVERFRLHLVADGSGSMQGTKNQEQKKALLLILESLADMTEQAQNNRKNLSAPIEFETSARIFTSSTVHTMKPMGEEFSDRERLESFSKLGIASGTTGDFVALSEVITEIVGDVGVLEKVRKGEQKEIVIVMTDGGSDDPSELQTKIKILRDQGVIVYGVDMAGDGSSATQNYGASETDLLGCGKSCPVIADLPGVFVDILAPHLERL